jgi:transcriptional regulator with XRE-family HTH domain
MVRPAKRTYSLYSQEAFNLLSKLIRTARIGQKLTVQEIANRAGVSRGLVQRIEKGDPKCEIGTVFEVATIVGVTLFETDQSALQKHTRQVEEKLALLPKSVRKQTKDVDDDF